MEGGGQWKGKHLVRENVCARAREETTESRQRTNLTLSERSKRKICSVHEDRDHDHYYHYYYDYVIYFCCCCFGFFVLNKKK